MAKKAVLQVRMDEDLKKEVEELYQDMGTSFSEAVRIFARQSVKEQRMPFSVTADNKNTFGRLSGYANYDLRMKEEHAMEEEILKKHEID